MADPFSLIVGIASLVELTATVVKLTCKYTHETRNSRESAQELLRELNILHTNLSHLDTLLRNDSQALGHFDDTSVLFSSTHACRDRLATLNEKLSQESSAGFSSLQMLAWPLKSKEHKQVLGELRAFGQCFQLALSIDGCALLSKTSTEVFNVMRCQLESFQTLKSIDERATSLDNSLEQQSQLLKESLAAQERDQLRNGISSVKHEQIHQDISKPRLNGTGTWLLENPRFTDWLGNTGQDGNTLCCYGIQGSGNPFLLLL